MTSPRASIITLTYNRKDLITAFDESLAKHCTQTPYEFIVMDNGVDGSGESVGGAVVLKNDNGGNFSSMNNIAACYAKSDILIFCNNDMTAHSDFVTDMVYILENNDGVGVVGACLYYPSRRLQHAGVVLGPQFSPCNLGDRAIKMLNLDPRQCMPVYWTGAMRFQAVTGACLAIRKSDFMKLLGFHEMFHWAFEDVDLCFRVGTLLKKACVVSPYSMLTHFESESGGTRNVDLSLELLRGRWQGIISPDYHLLQEASARRSAM